MRIWSRIVLIGFIMLTLLTQFNNCDTYSDNSVFTTFSSTCEGDDCFVQSADLLEIRVVQNIELGPTTLVFDIGGDCNEGGFPINKIKYSLFLNNVKKMTSSDDPTATTNKTSTCILGRFTATVSLPGKLCTSSTAPSAAATHRLDVELIARTETDGADIRNPQLAKRSINITPLLPYPCP